MDKFWIEVQDAEVIAALQRMLEAGENMQPHLQAIGDDVVERTKARFKVRPVGVAPDGTPWKENADATIDALTERLIGHRNKMGARSNYYRKKDGSLNAKGQARIANKRPLIGESGDLRRQIVAIASGNEVSINATPIYAAIHQFGGQAGRGLKVTIPARPYLPVRQDGSLYPSEREAILQAINDFMADGLMG